MDRTTLERTGDTLTVQLFGKYYTLTFDVQQRIEIVGIPMFIIWSSTDMITYEVGWLNPPKDGKMFFATDTNLNRPIKDSIGLGLKTREDISALEYNILLVLDWLVDDKILDENVYIDLCFRTSNGHAEYPFDFQQALLDRDRWNGVEEDWI